MRNVGRRGRERRETKFVSYRGASPLKRWIWQVAAGPYETPMVACLLRKKVWTQTNGIVTNFKIMIVCNFQPVRIWVSFQSRGIYYAKYYGVGRKGREK